MGPAQWAALAAALATGGDLLMLRAAVADAAGAATALPGWLLPTGAFLGVAGIPVYALGYRAAAHALPAGRRAASRCVAGGGAVAAGLGALIHGLTAWHLEVGLADGRAAGDPLREMVAGGALLVGLWGLAALGVLVASAAFAAGVGRDGSRLPRALALANPALLTLLLATAGLGSPLGRAYLVPAAPNLAHVLFFATLAGALRRGKQAGPR